MHLLASLCRPTTKENAVAVTMSHVWEIPIFVVFPQTNRGGGPDNNNLSILVQIFRAVYHIHMIGYSHCIQSSKHTLVIKRNVLLCICTVQWESVHS